jgi:hypothetical protein
LSAESADVEIYLHGEKVATTVRLESLKFYTVDKDGIRDEVAMAIAISMLAAAATSVVLHFL